MSNNKMKKMDVARNKYQLDDISVSINGFVDAMEEFGVSMKDAIDSVSKAFILSDDMLDSENMIYNDIEEMLLRSQNLKDQMFPMTHIITRLYWVARSFDGRVVLLEGGGEEWTKKIHRLDDFLLDLYTIKEDEGHFLNTEIEKDLTVIIKKLSEIRDSRYEYWISDNRHFKKMTKDYFNMFYRHLCAGLFYCLMADEIESRYDVNIIGSTPSFDGEQWLGFRTKKTLVEIQLKFPKKENGILFKTHFLKNLINHYNILLDNGLLTITNY